MLLSHDDTGTSMKFLRRHLICVRGRSNKISRLKGEGGMTIVKKCEDGGDEIHVDNLERPKLTVFDTFYHDEEKRVLIPSSYWEFLEYLEDL